MKRLVLSALLAALPSVAAVAQTISADGAVYQQGSPRGWWALNNTWNRVSLVNGTDYTETITVNPATFPSGSVISWTWPNVAAPNNVYSYPEIVFGAQDGTRPSPDGVGPAPIQLKNLSAFTGSYSIGIGGSIGNFDVL